jgi:putative aldouronate transport system substrate-binding protein
MLSSYFFCCARQRKFSQQKKEEDNLKAKNIISMALALLMVLSLTIGCQKSGGTASTADPSTSTESKGAVPTGDPVKISVGSQSEYQTVPCQWYETDVFQELQKQANVIIDSFNYYDADKFNMLLAGNDMPDIIFSYSPQKLPDIIDAKLALDLKPYLSTYTDIDGDAYKQSNQIISSYYGGEEKALYFLATYIGLELRDGGTINYRGYFPRWDWFKEIGAPEIKTSDDYIAAIEAMVAKHPTTADGKKVYGTGLEGTNFENWYTNGCFSKPAYMNLWTFGGYLYMEGLDDGKLYNAYTNLERSAFWEDMKFYNKLWNKGLLDPDSFTMTAEQRQAKSAAGQYAVEMNWPNDDLYAAESAKDPNTLAGIIAIPSEASFVFADYHQVNGYFPSNFQFVSANSKAIDGALSFLNVCRKVENQRLIYSGFEGKHYTIVDGVPTPTEETLAMRLANSDEWKKSGIGNTCNFSFLQGSFLAADGCPVDLFDTDEMRASALNPLQKDYCEYYKVDYPAQACVKLADEGKIPSMKNCYSELNQSCTETMPTDIQRILTQCNDILFAAIPGLVQAKTADEFKAIQDQVLADLKAANEETAWEWCLAANTKAQEFTKPIIETLKW